MDYYTNGAHAIMIEMKNLYRSVRLPMKSYIKKNTYVLIALCIIMLFVIINVLTLMAFPTVHSDELWLKGIANEMSFQKSFRITEPFFDAYPRVVHPFRWAYNAVLIPFLSLNNHVFSVRLVSLVFAAFCLWIFYKIMREQFVDAPYMALIGLATLTFNIQFIYSSHMGRQETMILFALLLGYYWIITHKSALHYALLVLITMGVHPNSFILGVLISGLLFYHAIFDGAQWKKLFQYLGLMGMGLLLYFVVGIWLNPNFVSEYFTFGASLGIDSPNLGRFNGFYWYFYKLYQQIGGTYDLFNLKGHLLTLALLCMGWTPFIAYSLYKKTPKYFSGAYVSLVSIFIALLLIARYNQTAIVFIMPFIILLLLETSKLHKRGWLIPLCFLIFSVINLSQNINTYEKQRFYQLPYEEMVNKLAHALPENAVVFGNLNGLEAFDAHAFYDIRNLAFIETDLMTYFKERGITHIVLHDEMDYLARNAQTWGFLYGNMDHYEALQSLIQAHGTLVSSFENPLYAMRISRFSGTYPWETRIYKVDLTP